MNQRFFKSVLSAASLALALSAITGATHSEANAQAAPTPATASAKPDFNGTWKVNLTKSQFSPAPSPSTQTTILTLSGDDLTIAFDSVDENGKQQYTHALKIGGPEVTFPKTGNQGPLVVLSSQAVWRDSSIIVTDKITYEGGAGWLVSTYTLSPDGKTLTKAFSASIDQGTFNMVAVYDKA
jgi:hypothetical protein